MRFLLKIVLSLLVFTAASPPVAAAADGRVRGIVSDALGGVLPGVTVVATSQTGQILATAVTDGTGGYVLTLPPGRVTLTFDLEGFSSAIAEAAVEPNRDVTVAPRLAMAQMSETVDVHGDAPADPPPPPAFVVAPVPNHDRSSVCGPAKPGAVPESFGTIQSLRHAADNELYGKGDELLIDGGAFDGLEVGRNFVVRRHYVVSRDPLALIGEHTAGLVQIVAATDHDSVAVVVYACDALMRGDYLSPFRPEPRRAPEPFGIPAYDNAAKILFGDIGQLLGAPRRLMVIDRGSEQDVRIGQRWTLFRRRRVGAASAVIGDAIVVSVRDNSATVRIEHATDVIQFGDWAAPQRAAAVTTPSLR
jgi:hypothetical protein